MATPGSDDQHRVLFAAHQLGHRCHSACTELGIVSEMLSGNLSRNHRPAPGADSAMQHHGARQQLQEMHLLGLGRTKTRPTLPSGRLPQCAFRGWGAWPSEILRIGPELDELIAHGPRRGEILRNRQGARLQQLAEAILPGVWRQHLPG